MLIFSLHSCKEEVDPNEAANNAIAGNWEVTSFTSNGTELMQIAVTSFEMEYMKQGPFDGETEWTLFLIDGSASKTEGDYQIENSGSEIDIDGDDFDLEIDGDKLEIQGILNGERVIINAERD